MQQRGMLLCYLWLVKLAFTGTVAIFLFARKQLSEVVEFSEVMHWLLLRTMCSAAGARDRAIALCEVWHI